jgi:hypothetical protein
MIALAAKKIGCRKTIGSLEELHRCGLTKFIGRAIVYLKI